jgi:predicted XRE-type DNA-binding protein
MTRHANKHIGSDFDDFLEEEGILPDVELVAIKRVLAFQMQALMKEQKLTQAEMAARMSTSRSSLKRLLDPSNPSVTLQTLQRAAAVLGKRLRIELT